MVRADFDTDTALWTVTLERDGKQWEVTCGWLFGATGYYNYDEAHTALRGPGGFEGRIVHPQFWPEDLDYQDKRVVVIGSGATAVTLIPAMAEDTRTSPCCSARLPMDAAAAQGSDSPTGCERCCRRRRPTRSPVGLSIGRQRFIC